MAYSNGVRIWKPKPTPGMDSTGVYDVLLNGQKVATLWNNPGDLATGWKSTTWYVENHRFGLNRTYQSFNVARTALKSDDSLLGQLQQIASSPTETAK